MATFYYNPLAESVTVKYECPQCGHVNEDTFGVPEPDMLAETHHDSINQDFDDAVCEKCSTQFNVILTNGFYGGEGEIEGVETIIDVDESIPGEDEEYYDKQLFKDTHSDTEKALDAIEGLSQDIKDNFYRLLYANIISKLEVFLCDTIVSYVLSCEAHKQTFVQKYKPLAEQKFPMKSIYAKYNSLDKIIKGALTSIVYHDLDLVRKLYKNVADIDLAPTKEIEDAIDIRHDIVHRNGKDKDGNMLNICKNDVEQLSDHILDFIYEVDTMVQNKNASEAIPDGLLPFSLNEDENGVVGQCPKSLFD